MPKATTGDVFDADTRQALEDAERSGLRLMLLVRTAIMGLVMIAPVNSLITYGNPTGVLLGLAVLLPGLFVWRTLGTRYERRWHRYALVLIDVTTITLGAVFVPLSGTDEVPRIFLFRTLGVYYLYLLLILWSLSLSPRLVLAAGCGLAAALGIIFLAALSEIERPLSWSDLAPGATGGEFASLVLDPDFVGYNNRITEAVGLIAGAFALAAAVQRARRTVVAFASVERRRQRVERLFGQYVPAAVAEQILTAPGALQPSVQTGSALFVDVEGFTRFAADRPPERVLSSLDAFLALVTETVTRHGGVPIGFGGDSVLATFGVPLRSVDFAGDALRSAHALLAQLEKQDFDGIRFAVRIGIASGEIAAGSVGGSQRQSFTVYGAAVNLAQRLEHANKALGSRLIACERTLTLGGIVSAEARELHLPGFDQPIRVAVLHA